MIAIDVKQGGEEWFKLKCGKPGSSSFDKIIQTNGKPSKERKKYLYRLAGERITGKQEATYSNAIMERGIELEVEARVLYEIATGLDVQTTGVCYPDDTDAYLCSPDGLVGEDGGLEIKSPLMATHVSYLVDNKLPTTYFQQVQGSLLVTGREWWSFMSYYPGIKPLIVRVERDEPFIAMLKSELDLFVNELETITTKIGV